nr:E3 ubiquitin-protein ligase TRIM7-like [Pelodiscus sinensis]|eukprot:XP_014429130.1 E3 ubiquitin-protein ligase TRIM7-like [Pelodiscus sinensis]
MVQLVRRLEAPGAPPSGPGRCGAHGEPLKLFCELDRRPICVVCDRSRAHRGHPVIPAEEAAQEYKEQIQTRLQALKEEREKLLQRQRAEEEKSQEYLEQTRAERQKIGAEILQFRQLLEEQERLLLARLGALEKELAKQQKENGDRLAGEISRLGELIGELEGKCRQPASEFLQDIGSTLSRCEGAPAPQAGESPSQLAQSLGDFSQKRATLEETLRKCKETVIFNLALEGSQFCVEDLEDGGEPADVTLDPDTAHPKLALSGDGKSLSYSNTPRVLPPSPKRFEASLCVLGREGFSVGRRCWEVEVGAGGGWAVGVARESVPRKGPVTYSPAGGIWGVALRRGQYLALTAPEETPLSLSAAPARIRVALDYAGGRVTFSDPERQSPVFTFRLASFGGERLLPFFWAVGTDPRLRLAPSKAPAPIPLPAQSQPLYAGLPARVLPPRFRRQTDTAPAPGQWASSVAAGVPQGKPRPNAHRSRRGSQRRPPRTAGPPRRAKYSWNLPDFFLSDDDDYVPFQWW